MKIEDICCDVVRDVISKNPDYDGYVYLDLSDEWRVKFAALVFDRLLRDSGEEGQELAKGILNDAMNQEEWCYNPLDEHDRVYIYRYMEKALHDQLDYLMRAIAQEDSEMKD